MNRSAQKLNRVPRRRRYLVHLCCAHDEGSRACRYVARIQLWKTCSSVHAKTQERVFTDEYELIEPLTHCSLTAPMSVTVISHIENPDGFLYLLYLSSEEASSLGCGNKSRSSDHEVQG
jgi:hypothetical protein